MQLGGGISLGGKNGLALDPIQDTRRDFSLRWE